VNIDEIEIKEEPEKIQGGINMKKIFFYLICYSSTLVIESCQDNSKMVEFKPMIFNKNGNYVTLNSIPENFYDNLKLVLKNYNIEYIDSSGKIFIRKKEYDNKEIVANFTLKAMDTIWINSLK
jgi:hypothetical protein